RCGSRSARTGHDLSLSLARKGPRRPLRTGRAPVAPVPDAGAADESDASAFGRWASGVHGDHRPGVPEPTLRGYVTRAVLPELDRSRRPSFRLSLPQAVPPAPAAPEPGRPLDS